LFCWAKELGLSSVKLSSFFSLIFFFSKSTNVSLFNSF
jgi:hypothetical protein